MRERAGTCGIIVPIVKCKIFLKVKSGKLTWDGILASVKQVRESGIEISLDKMCGICLRQVRECGIMHRFKSNVIQIL